MLSKLTIHAIVVFCLRVCLAGSAGYQIVEQLENAPLGWLRGDQPDPSTLIKFRLSVDSGNIESFQQNVIDLSTPGHPSYGQHLSLEQVRQQLSPPPEVSNRIVSWLNSENITADSIATDGNWFTFSTSVAQAERLLKTQFFHYQKSDTETSVIRSLQYSVPSEIHSLIQVIQPTTRFAEFSRPQAVAREESIPIAQRDYTTSCGTVVTPGCLRDLYDLGNSTALPDVRNRLGIAGFLEEYAHHSDFFEFIQVYAPNQVGANFSVQSINGGQNDESSTKSSIEANMDVQYAITLAYNVLATFYTTAGRGPLVPDKDQPNASHNTNEPYLEQLHYMVNLPDSELPAVLSMSYGEAEQTVPKEYATAVCNLFAQLGARGVSVIFSSGDEGPGHSCQSNDGSYRAKFLPDFPASCPFVTSVGGTFEVEPEKAISFSGGGFSDYFQRPSYQDALVQRYIDKYGARWTGLYNPLGRGIPDVAAQSNRFVVRDHGTYLSVGGTRFVSTVI